MSAPYRIEKPVEGVRETDEGFKQYLGRLLKMIPAEVVGVYMIGSGFIPTNQAIGLAIWAVVCLVLVIIVRLYGTADPPNDKPTQPVPVLISSVAFVIWIYWLGGPFVMFNLHIPWVGSLAVLVWSFVIPIFYKGDPES